MFVSELFRSPAADRGSSQRASERPSLMMNGVFEMFTAGSVEGGFFVTLRVERFFFASRFHLFRFSRAAAPLQTVHDASNPAEVNRFLDSGGFISATGRFQGVLEPSRTVGDVDVKAGAPKGCIASFPEVGVASLYLLVLCR